MSSTTLSEHPSRSSSPTPPVASAAEQRNITPAADADGRTTVDAAAQPSHDSESEHDSDDSDDEMLCAHGHRHFAAHVYGRGRGRGRGRMHGHPRSFPTGMFGSFSPYGPPGFGGLREFRSPPPFGPFRHGHHRPPCPPSPLHDCPGHSDHLFSQRKGDGHGNRGRQHPYRYHSLDHRHFPRLHHDGLEDKEHHGHGSRHHSRSSRHHPFDRDHGSLLRPQIFSIFMHKVPPYSGPGGYQDFAFGGPFGGPPPPPFSGLTTDGEKDDPEGADGPPLPPLSKGRRRGCDSRSRFRGGHGGNCCE